MSPTFRSAHSGCCPRNVLRSTGAASSSSYGLPYSQTHPLQDIFSNERLPKNPGGILIHSAFALVGTWRNLAIWGVDSSAAVCLVRFTNINWHILFHQDLGFFGFPWVPPFDAKFCIKSRAELACHLPLAIVRGSVAALLFYEDEPSGTGKPF